MKTASIISVGNELLSGLVIDTNASFLSSRLLSLGIPAVAFYTVGDTAGAIAGALEQACGAADIVIVTGGLGPTDDDVTREGLAEFMGVELELDEAGLREISGFFAKRGLDMSESNKRQALLPVGATAMGNDLGTAPGIMAKHSGKVIFVLPGVPSEMERMFDGSVYGQLKSYGDGQAVVSGKVRCFGAGESTVADMLGDLMARGRNPLINCTVSGGIITLHIVATAKCSDEAEKMVAAERERLCGILGELVFGWDDQTLAEVVGGELAKQGMSLAVAESCTGGLVCKMITDVAGSSRYFQRGWTTYSNEAKVSELGVAAELIERCGAVSEEVAGAMALAAQQKAGTDFGIGITGIAGPGGGSVEKPVGLVYIAVAGANGCQVKGNNFSGSRGRIRLRSALLALNMLRLSLKI